MTNLRKAHRKATLRKVIKVTRVDDTEIKTKTVERISNVSLKAFAKANEANETVAAAHKAASKARTKEKAAMTRLKTQANRDARKKRSNNNASKPTAPATTVK